MKRKRYYYISMNYVSGKTYFEGQSKAGVLPRFNADRENARAMRAKHQAANQQSPSSYTFTDLAQMVCKVSRGSRYIDLDIDSDSEEEYEADLEEDAQEVGYASEPTVGILDQVGRMLRLSLHLIFYPNRNGSIINVPFTFCFFLSAHRVTPLQE